MKPSLFASQRPWSSTLGRMEYEVVAQNIMRILSRTGDNFRELEWDEYESERKKEQEAAGQTTGLVGFEKPYFEKVKYLALGDGDRYRIRNFSPDWGEIADKHSPILKETRHGG